MYSNEIRGEKNKMKWTQWFTLTLFSLLAMTGGSNVVQAADAQVMALVKDLQKQMSSMQGTIDRQNSRIKDLEGTKSSVKVDESMGYTQGALPEGLEEASKWLKDLKWGGDFRLRYEAQSEHGGTNAPDRNRFRYRLRYGFEKAFYGTPLHEDDQFKVGFRLASGGDGGITSTNQTFDTNFGQKAISINRAYATYLPAWATFQNEDGIGLSGTEITAGKFKNPFYKSGTWMMWDSDVEPEGIYEQFDFNVVKSEDLELTNRTILGQLVLEEGSGPTDDDAELIAYSTVFESQIKGIFEKPLKMKNAFSYYTFSDFGLAGNNAGGAGNNTLSATGAATLARSFNVINIYNEIAMPFQVHKAKGFKVYYDFLKNVEGDGLDSEKGSGDMAWMLGAKLGSAKKKGSWELKYEYAMIESNASPDAFNDSDFGGTDRRGSIVGAKYAITDYLSFGLKGFFTDRIQGASSERDLWQMDMVWKF